MSQLNTEMIQGPCVRLAQCRIPTITGFLKLLPFGPHITAGLNCVCPSEKSTYAHLYNSSIIYCSDYRHAVNQLKYVSNFHNIYSYRRVLACSRPATGRTARVPFAIWRRLLRGWSTSNRTLCTLTGNRPRTRWFPSSTDSLCNDTPRHWSPTGICLHSGKKIDDHFSYYII